MIIMYHEQQSNHEDLHQEEEELLFLSWSLN